MKFKLFKKKEKEKTLAEQNKELDEQYKNMLFKTRIQNAEEGKDYNNLPINKNLVLVSETEKNEAEKKKHESQTQSKFVNGVQVGCTVVSTAAAVGLWVKDQKGDCNTTRTEVGKTISTYGKNIIGHFKKQK